MSAAATTVSQCPGSSGASSGRMIVHQPLIQSAAMVSTRARPEPALFGRSARAPAGAAPAALALASEPGVGVPASRNPRRRAGLRDGDRGVAAVVGHEDVEAKAEQTGVEGEK